MFPSSRCCAGAMLLLAVGQPLVAHKAVQPAPPEVSTGADNVEIYAHRGWGCSSVGTASVVAENSIAALERAVSAGITGAEIDVWMTSDGEVLVIHGSDTGMLHHTTTVNEDSEWKTIQTQTVEELEKCNALTLKESWVVYKMRQEKDMNANKLRGSILTDYATEVCEAFHNLPADEQKRLKEEWTHIKTPSADGSRVPTLKEVFQKFNGRLKFNVELKGTNPDLGMKVLEIAEPFKGVIGRISSFNWVAPSKKLCSRKGSVSNATALLPPGATGLQEDVTLSSSDDAKIVCPESDTTGMDEQVAVDLLKPIVNNTQNIPLALLFEKGVPDIEVVRSLNAYNSEWAHMPHTFWEELKYDAGPDGSEPQATEKLRKFVDKLAMANKKVMTWWYSTSVDRLEDIQMSLEAGVASICPNDVELALKAIRLQAS